MKWFIINEGSRPDRWRQRFHTWRYTWKRHQVVALQENLNRSIMGQVEMDKRMDIIQAALHMGIEQVGEIHGMIYDGHNR